MKNLLRDPRLSGAELARRIFPHNEPLTAATRLNQISKQRGSIMQATAQDIARELNSLAQEMTATLVSREGRPTANTFVQRTAAVRKLLADPRIKQAPFAKLLYKNETQRAGENRLYRRLSGSVDFEKHEVDLLHAALDKLASALHKAAQSSPVPAADAPASPAPAEAAEVPAEAPQRVLDPNLFKR